MMRSSQARAPAAFDAVFAKVVNLIDANGFADGLHLACGGLEGVGAPEGGDLVSFFSFGGKVVRDLHAVVVAPDRAHAIKDVVHRRGAEGPCGGKLLVRIGDGEAFLIVLDHLRAGIARGDPVAIAGDIHGGGVALAFTLDHPLRQHQPDATALAEARHYRAGGPVVAHARHRTHQRVAIGGEGEGAVDHRFDTGLGQGREASVRKINALFDLVKVVGEQFVAKIPGRAIDRPGSSRAVRKTRCRGRVPPVASSFHPRGPSHADARRRHR